MLLIYGCAVVYIWPCKYSIYWLSFQGCTRPCKLWPWQHQRMFSDAAGGPWLCWCLLQGLKCPLHPLRAVRNGPGAAPCPGRAPAMSHVAQPLVAPIPPLPQQRCRLCLVGSSRKGGVPRASQLLLLETKKVQKELPRSPVNCQAKVLHAGGKARNKVLLPAQLDN